MNMLSKSASVSAACCRVLIVFGLSAMAAAGQETNALALTAPPLPDVSLSLVRVLGALILVISLFLGGVWLFRNWQRLTFQRGRAPRLSVLETRSLGGRYALHVVGYEQERFLIAASPAGVSLVSHLQNAGEDAADSTVAATIPFAQNVAQLLSGRSRPPAKAAVLP